MHMQSGVACVFELAPASTLRFMDRPTTVRPLAPLVMLIFGIFLDRFIYMLYDPLLSIFMHVYTWIQFIHNK